MNPKYLGDSYDLVKRFFISELRNLGYDVVVDPMFTGAWGQDREMFHVLVGAPERSQGGLVSGATFPCSLGGVVGINGSVKKAGSNIALQGTPASGAALACRRP
jgi:hypothetical protein